MKKDKCYLCKSQICPYGSLENCDCEKYWRHHCSCGPVCKKHNVAYWYDDSYCIYCFPKTSFFIPFKGYSPYKEYCTNLAIKRESAQYWISIAPKLNVCKDVAKMISLLLIT